MHNGALACGDFGGTTLLLAHGTGKNSRACAKRKNPIRWKVYMHEKCDYQSNNLGVLI